MNKLGYVSSGLLLGGSQYDHLQNIPVFMAYLRGHLDLSSFLSSDMFAYRNANLFTDDAVPKSLKEMRTH